MQLLDDPVVVRVVLESAPGIDHTGHTQAVHLPHEVTSRVLLIFGRQLWPLGQGGVKNRGVGLRDEQTRRIATGVADGRSDRTLLRVSLAGASCVDVAW